MTNVIQLLPYFNYPIEVVPTGGDPTKTPVVLKRICEHLGISWGSQRHKLKSNNILTCVDINTVALG